MKKVLNSLIFRLFVGLIIGIVAGAYVNADIISVVMVLKNISGDIIMYMVPLIILGFIAPAIVGLKENAGKILATTLGICYLSSIGAAFFSYIAANIIVPYLNIRSNVDGGNALPEVLFSLKIDPIMSVMTALITSILIGLAVLFTNSETWGNMLNEFNKMILWIVDKVVVTLLPFYIMFNFAILSYEGRIIYELPVFIKVILIVIVGHFIWMALLYSIAGGISGKNPVNVFRYYGPAYVTALGTMSSAATLPVALRCASKSPILEPRIKDFVIPICANTHLCGSVLTETFFVMVVSKILYGQLPDPSQMILFILLLGIFAIAAPGVPGGTVVASLGLITSVLGFDDAGTALMLAIFALQDSFGTACNITGDGAIALMVTGLFRKKKKDGEANA